MHEGVPKVTYTKFSCTVSKSECPICTNRNFGDEAFVLRHLAKEHCFLSRNTLKQFKAMKRQKQIEFLKQQNFYAYSGDVDTWLNSLLGSNLGKDITDPHLIKCPVCNVATNEGFDGIYVHLKKVHLQSQVLETDLPVENIKDIQTKLKHLRELSCDHQNEREILCWIDQMCALFSPIKSQKPKPDLNICPLCGVTFDKPIGCMHHTLVKHLESEQANVLEMVRRINSYTDVNDQLRLLYEYAPEFGRNQAAVLSWTSAFLL